MAPAGSGPDPEEEPGQTERMIRSLEELHARHYRDMPGLARLSHRLTGVLAEPLVVCLILVGVLGWIAFNSLAGRLGLRAFDPYPFSFLQSLGAIFAVVTTLLILATQSREDKLDERRSQLTLQMAALGEQKSAKIIALLEELRRDSPNLISRPDPEADEMASPSDPNAVMDRITETHRGPEE